MSENAASGGHVSHCESCKITLQPGEKIGERMGDPDGFFCSDPDCPIMRGAPTSSAAVRRERAS